MARGKGSGERIEPSFETPKKAKRGEDLRADPDDRPKRGRAPASKTKAAAKPAARRSGGLFGFLRFAVYWSFVLSLWGAIGIAGLVVYYGMRMPSANSWALPDRPPNIKIIDMNGDIVANRGSTGGEALPLDQMSPYIPQAVIAIEDRRFYSHFGVDPIGLARAMMRNVMAGRMVQGGSTLSQQLAKNMFLSPERTLERKVQEVLLALWLEHTYSKDEILAMYLNRVFFGSNSYGVEAASRRYFNKSARDVTLAEAATLAGLLKAPSALSPAKNPKGAADRAQLVLRAMAEEGFVTQDEVASAISQKPAKAKRFWSGAEHYAADLVVSELPVLIGEIKEDIIVDTTLDLALERKADKAITAILGKEGERLNASQAAMVAIDGTGAIRVLVGGRDYAESQFDRATKARRQPGSAFKPFVYGAAVEAGLTPDSVRNDAPVKIGKWTPENYDNKYRGRVTLAQALAQSLNTVAAQMVMEVGPDNVAKFARRLGIESELQANASIALGTSETSLLELTAAYAPFMNGGYKATPHIIRRITTASGKVLYENTYDEPPKVIDLRVAATMNAMLSRVITHGTGKAAQLPGWQVAGKTGTTQGFKDALFVGYTADMVTGVWYGNDNGDPMKKVTGGGLPAKTWAAFMAEAVKERAPAPLPGLGRPLAEEPVANNKNAAPAADEEDSLFDLINQALSDDDARQDKVRTKVEAPVAEPQAVEAVRRPVVPAEEPLLDDGDMPVPPADVGITGATGRKANSTLLDVITGQ